MTSLLGSPAQIWSQVGYRPHELQVQVHRARAEYRSRAVSAGRRVGKSKLGGNELIVEAVSTKPLLAQLEATGQRREFWIVGPEYTDSEKEFRVLYDGLKRLDAPFDRPGTYYNAESGNLHISMFGGKFMVSGKSAKYPDSLVGEGLSGVILAEAAKLKPRIYTKFIRPMLADFNGWLLATSTPEGKNWFYEMWVRGQDPADLEWWSVRAPSWSNPFVYPLGATKAGIKLLRETMKMGQPITPQLAAASGVDPEIISQMRDQSEESFNQEIAAEFTEFVGRVFKDFDEEVHVGDLPFNPSWQTYAAIDYGFTNPTVWLIVQVDPFNELINVVAEHYERGLTPRENALEIKRKGLCPESLIALYPDPASPGDTKEFVEQFRVPSRAGTGGEVQDRLELIRRALKVNLPHLAEDHPEVRPKLMIDRRCTNTIREFLNYRYPESADNKNPSELPMKKDDHTPEALGRFFAGHFKSRELKQRARVRTANLSGS